MNCLAEILPLFFIRWYSRKYLERFTIDGRRVTMPRDDVYVRIPTKFICNCGLDGSHDHNTCGPPIEEDDL